MDISESDAFICCSSHHFAKRLSAGSPFPSWVALEAEARRLWWNEVSISGWLEAFAAHPRIGDLSEFRERLESAFIELSQNEQSAAASSSTDTTLQELVTWNKMFEEKFGHIFIICAADKSADIMLRALKERYANPPYKELQLAAAEQMKITLLRLKKVLRLQAGRPGSIVMANQRSGRIMAHVGSLRSPITTHVLDTSCGRPASDVPVTLHKLLDGTLDCWECIASSATNQDGRIGNLLAPSDTVVPGHYRVDFDTARYMDRCHAEHPSFYVSKPFYPSVSVRFYVGEDHVHQHFHIPLTWNPYGYSTYRGS